MMYDDSSSGLIPNKTLNNTLHDAEELSNKKVTRTSAKNYEIQFSFDSLATAKDSFAKRKCDSSCQQNCRFCDYLWSHYQSTQLKEGEKLWYKCRGNKCPCRLQLFNNGTSAILSIAGDHSHEAEV